MGQEVCIAPLKRAPNTAGVVPLLSCRGQQVLESLIPDSRNQTRTKKKAAPLNV